MPVTIPLFVFIVPLYSGSARLVVKRRKKDPASDSIRLLLLESATKSEGNCRPNRICRAPAPGSFPGDHGNYTWRSSQQKRPTERNLTIIGSLEMPNGLGNKTFGSRNKLGEMEEFGGPNMIRANYLPKKCFILMQRSIYFRQLADEQDVPRVADSSAVPVRPSGGARRAQESRAVCRKARRSHLSGKDKNGSPTGGTMTTTNRRTPSCATSISDGRIDRHGGRVN